MGFHLGHGNYKICVEHGAGQPNVPQPRVVCPELRFDEFGAVQVDRACPEGGWNAGNGVVYGVPMAAHLDATAAALLALHGEERNGVINSALDWLESSVMACSAPWSLAWSLLALEAYDRPVQDLADHLSDLDPDLIGDTATLAAVIVALDCLVQGNAFKVLA